MNAMCDIDMAITSVFPSVTRCVYCVSWKCIIWLLLRVIISVYWSVSLVIITTMKDYWRSRLVTCAIQVLISLKQQETV